ncbi:hypothetical protein TSAR_012834 [Trichomalopsis sarcophagae]|uniref:MATH domain-containing protein n=1 Tax=Trichomalopsis sarcophagae TaxID=543379 RepID=A0A232EWW1_9HYME|nr:hypothetical protein TSAR_012834 [Trichomalopsis sarcophagae]
MDVDTNNNIDRRNITKQFIQLFLLFSIFSLPQISAKVNTSDVGQWGSTEIKSLKFNYLWTVKNFSLYEKDRGISLESPFFDDTVINDPCNWSLLLYPGGRESDKEYLAIYVQYVSGKELSVRAEYKISVLDSSYNEIKTLEDHSIFNKGGLGSGSRKMILREYVLDPVNNVLRDDELAIYVEVAETRMLKGRRIVYFCTNSAYSYNSAVKYTMDQNVGDQVGVNRRCVTKSFVQLCLLLTIISLPQLALSKVDKSKVDQWGSTEVELVKFDYLWIVKNFSLYREKEGEFLKSPLFTSMHNGAYHWNVLLYPRGFFNGDYLTVDLQYVFGSVPTVAAEYKISVLNSTYDEIVNKHDSATFTRDGPAFGFREIVRRDYVMDAANNVLRNDELAIYVEVTEYRTISNPRFVNRN